MSKFRLLLLPLSLLYGIIIWIRNKFYDLGIFKSTSFELPVISVGNLEVGGSGKTPMTEYLIRLLSGYKLSTLSRGYGRKSTGFRWVLENDDPRLTGDEPLQVKNKFPFISVAVCENRVEGINKIKPGHDLVIMDDAYQHRAVKPGVSLLLFDYHTVQDFRLMLPAGNYREPFSGRKRADIIVITKTPEELSIAQQQNIESKLKLFPHQKLFFSYIRYSKNLINIFTGDLLATENLKQGTAVLLITGIAKPALLLDKVKAHTSQVVHLAYADHHQFSQKNMLKLVSDFHQLNQKEKIIITTQKDAVRLRTEEYRNLIGSLPIYEWPIETAFDVNKTADFETEILEYVKRNQPVS
jgi:tetraacyldisaccharide 4'-kinase